MVFAVLLQAAGLSMPTGAWATGDISPSISSSPNPVVRGRDVAYEVRLTYNGGGDGRIEDGSTIVLPLPANVTFEGLDTHNPLGLFCTTPSVGSSGTVVCTWTRGAVNFFSGTGLSIPALTVFTNSTNDAAATRSLTVTVNIASGDHNTSNNSATETTAVVDPSASTALQSSANPSTVGQSVTFTATVTGNASAPAPTGTVTFRDGTAVLGTGTLNGSGVATFTTSALATGTHSITASYGGDATYPGSTSPALSQSVGTEASAVTLASSVNPSIPNQSVTFTATVATNGATPTGTMTFRDGTAVLGSATLNGSGVATFTTSALALGAHAITASYSGDGNVTASNSSVLTQTVQVPADSVKLRALQIAVTKMVAQNSGQAITGAIDAAIGEGFEENGSPVTMSPACMRFNFAAEGRIEDSFEALAYNGIVRKAPPMHPEKMWLPWLEIRGTGWDVDRSRNGTRTDITGTQVNALAGLTHKLAPNLLLGAFGGYETFDYTSQQLNGRLKGEGWTVGGYFAWRLTPGLRLDAGVARSGVNYDAAAGTAAASFPGTRWLASMGFTGTHKAAGFAIEPSLKAYALWEREDAYIDTLGTAQTERDFMTGRASGGVKVAYPVLWGAGATVAPYLGAYADYYFSKDDAVAILLPGEFIQGWSARVTGGVSVTIPGGVMLSAGGEVGGLGSDFTVWTARGRASVPF